MVELRHRNLMTDEDSTEWAIATSDLIGDGYVAPSEVASSRSGSEHASPWDFDLSSMAFERAELKVNLNLEEVMFDDAYLPDADMQQSLLYPIFFARQKVGPEHYTKRTGWNCYEIVYTNAGRGALEVDGRTYELEPGSLALLDNRRPHLYRADDSNGWDYTFLHFDGGSAEYLCRQVQADGIVYEDVRHTGAGRALEGLVDLNHDHADDACLLFHSNLTDLLVATACLEPAPPAGTPDWLGDVERYIDEHCGEDLSLAELARRACLSESWFSHVFKESTGTSPIRYRNAARIEQAKRLLCQTDWPVERVGEEVGFRTLSNFYAKFRDETGVSPAAWREEHRRADRQA